MLSRRNVRIKVMQILFSRAMDAALDNKMVVRRYRESIDHFFELYLLNIYLILQIAERSTNDAKKRGAKHITDEYDKIFVDKLWSNEIIQFLTNNQGLIKKFNALKFDEKVDRDFIHKLYKAFSAEEEYQIYVKQDDTSKKDHLAILLSLYRFIRKNEFFEEQVENQYAAWNDDSSLVIGAVKRTLKTLPSIEEDFYSAYLPDDETVDDFGATLLKNVLQREDELKDIIAPTLKNWDMDRVANLDMILLKMASCEFLYFKSIPTKVTLNEYVEVSKMYSTDKSKDFVNGIMDRIMRDLQEQGKINKATS